MVNVPSLPSTPQLILNHSELWGTSTLRMFTLQGKSNRILTRRPTHHAEPVLLSMKSLPLLTRGPPRTRSNRGDTISFAVRRRSPWQSLMAQIWGSSSYSCVCLTLSHNHRKQGPRSRCGLPWSPECWEVYRSLRCWDCMLPLHYSKGLLLSNLRRSTLPPSQWVYESEYCKSHQYQCQYQYQSIYNKFLDFIYLTQVKISYPLIIQSHYL